MHIICMFFKYTFHQDRRLAFVRKPQCFFWTVLVTFCFLTALWASCETSHSIPALLAWPDLLWVGSCACSWPCVGEEPWALGACAVVAGILTRVLPCWLSQGSNNLLGLPCWDLAPPYPLLFHLLGKIGSSEQPFLFPSLTKVFHK